MNDLNSLDGIKWNHPPQRPIVDKNPNWQLITYE